jgi:integrase
MAATKTPGVAIDEHGHRLIDKQYRGTRIYARLGRVTQADAERRLDSEIVRVNHELEDASNRRLRFVDGAARYLEDSRSKRSVDVPALHIRLLIPYIGALELRNIHDATLQPFIARRIEDGVTATTINRSLEVVRTILNRAARSYRNAEGEPWLAGLPPLITMLPETRRTPYPITWDEQDRLFPRLPDRLARMALFAVNTGLRESNVCGLQWTWEVRVPEVARSVFVIPPEAFKSKRAHVAILNDVAWSVIESSVASIRSGCSRIVRDLSPP